MDRMKTTAVVSTYSIVSANSTTRQVAVSGKALTMICETHTRSASVTASCEPKPYCLPRMAVGRVVQVCETYEVED